MIPDDVQALAGPVLAHRLLPTAEAMVERQLPDRVVAGIVEQTPLPRMRRVPWPPPPRRGLRQRAQRRVSVAAPPHEPVARS